MSTTGYFNNSKKQISENRLLNYSAHDVQYIVFNYRINKETFFILCKIHTKLQ